MLKAPIELHASSVQKLSSYKSLVKKTHRAIRVNLGEGGFRITKATSRKVEEIVPLAFETRQVAALIASFMRRVYCKCFVLFNI